MIKRAFVLAAGLGTRLRPLTDQLPKPLIPVGRKPLITFAFDHLIAEAGIEEFIVNTHHLPAAFAAAFPKREYRGRPLHFRHEPALLDTGGGIRNIADLIRGEPFLVYNGDILTDLPIAPLIEAHRAAGNEVTLALRSLDGPKHMAWDASSGRILDIRNMLGSGAPAEFGFGCVYVVEPAFLERFPRSGVPVSVIPAFLEMIRQGARLGGAVLDEGMWRDLGSREEYLRAHRDLHAQAGPGAFPRYGAPDPAWREWIDPTARIAPDACISGASAVGAGARIGAGAALDGCIVWPGGEIASSSTLKNCIVRSSAVAAGHLTDAVV